MINITVKSMEAKDIALTVLGIAFGGGLCAVEIMAGLYPDRVIYTIPAQKPPVPQCSEYCREILGTKQTDEALEKQCREYLHSQDHSK